MTTLRQVASWLGQLETVETQLTEQIKVEPNRAVRRELEQARVDVRRAISDLGDSLRHLT